MALVRGTNVPEILRITPLAKKIGEYAGKQLLKKISEVSKKKGYGTKGKGKRHRRRVGGMLKFGGAGKPFIPRQALITHRYSQSFAMTGSDQILTKEFSLNSIYQPEPSVSSLQPYGSDQMATFYQRYTVVGASYKVTFHSGTHSAAGIAMNAKTFCLIGRTDANGSQENIPDTVNEFYMEGWRGGGRIRHAYGGKGPTTMYGTWSARRQFKEYIDDDDLIRDTKIGAPFGSNPVTQAKLDIGFFRDDAGDPLDVTVRVHIDYHVLWHDPTVLALS